MTHSSSPLSLVRSAVSVRFHAVSILQPVVPCALVPGRAVETLAEPVPALEAMGPLAAVTPAPLGLYPQPVALALVPIALVGVAARPGVHSHHLEAVRPGAAVLALALWPRTDAVAVGFAVFPAAAVTPAIIEVEPSSSHA